MTFRNLAFAEGPSVCVSWSRTDWFWSVDSFADPLSFIKLKKNKKKSWIDQIDELDHFPEYDIYVTNTGAKDIYTQVSLTELHKLIPEESYETADVYRIEF